MWLGHIALMKPSTDELWEHRSLSYSCNEVAGVNESHAGTEREEDEYKKIKKKNHKLQILTKNAAAAL